MKRCPECRRDYYDDTLLYCLDDGTALLEGPSSLDPVTEVITKPESSKGGRSSEAATRLYDGDSPVTVEVRKHRYATIFVIGAGAILLGALGYGLYKLLKQTDPPQPQRSADAMKTQRLTGDGKTRGAEISPDGRFLAYIRTEGDERSLWLKQIQTNSNIQIVKPGELDRFDDLVFSPDGNFLYFDAETAKADLPSYYRVPVLGGTPTKMLTNAVRMRFSPDGKQVSFGRLTFDTNETAVFIADVDGSNERKIAFRTGMRYFDGSPVWSPDGKTIAMPSGDDTLIPNPSVTVSMISVEGGAEPVELSIPRWTRIDDIVWHPTGDSLIISANDGTFAQNQLWEVSYPSAAIRRLTNSLSGYNSVSITADGKALVTGEIVSRSAVWVSPDLKPENAKPLMPATGDTWGFGWTPDNRIVYVSDQSGDAEVWIMDADGSNARLLTNDKVFKTTPVVSPDGRYIVYAAATKGGHLVRIDIDGGNPLILDRSSGAENPDISPDGRWIVHSAWVDGMSKIYRVPIDGGEPEQLTDYRATEPRYSRDGKSFACFIPNEKTQVWTRLAIVSADGGPPLKVFDAPPNTNIGRGPIWTPDDRGITLIVAPGEKQNLWLQPVDGGEGKAMTDFDVPGIARREYSSDGKRIAIVRAEGIGNAIMITDYR